jgi:hypothetical protein
VIKISNNSPDVTWRNHPFQKGQTYIAQESFVGFPTSEFAAGHNYVFHGVAYSPYDSSTIFTFHELGSSEPIYWWWHDEQSQLLCQQYFKPV